MTKFIKDKFYINGMYVVYNIDGKSKFVASFKYQPRTKNTFITFLVKNFTVEEYFTRMDAGEAPLTIVMSKGYLPPQIKKLMKALGYPLTLAGYEQLITTQVNVA
jgi:hypothetical protein